MPDITMCTGEDCPLKGTCHRATATPSELQPYFVDPPFKEKMGGAECAYYWYNRKYEEKS